jgi:flagellar capping protein FliD
VTALNAADTSGVLVTSANPLVTSLLPGRNYSLSIIALVMVGIESDSIAVYQATSIMYS